MNKVIRYDSDADICPQIEAGIHYPIPIHEQEAYRGEFIGVAGDLPVASEMAKRQEIIVIKMLT